MFYWSSSVLLPFDQSSTTATSHHRNTTINRTSTYPHGPPPPPAGLQALLLHWMLQPQLAAAGLPHLPSSLLPELLVEAVARSSREQLNAVPRWGVAWPVTMLDLQGSCGVTTAAVAGGVEVATAAELLQLQQQQQQQQQGMTGVATARDFMDKQQQHTVHQLLQLSVWGGAGDGSDCSSATGNLSDTSSATAAHLAGVLAAARAVLQDSARIDKQYSLNRHGVSGLRAVAGALVRHLAPRAPLLLLVAEQLLQQQQVRNHATASELLELVLQGCSSSALHAPTLSCVIAEAVAVLQPAGDSSSSSSSSGRGLFSYSQVVDATVAVLLALPPHEMLQVVANVQEELQLQPNMSAAAVIAAASVCTAGNSTSSRVWGDVVVALCSSCNPDQAVALLQVLQLPYWATAFAIFASPVEGAFSYCCGAPLAQFVATATMERKVFSKAMPRCSFKKAAAAWQVLLAHYSHQEVVAEVNYYRKQQEVEQGAPGNLTAAASSGADFISVGSSSSSSSSRGDEGFLVLVGGVLEQFAREPEVQAVQLFALMTVLPAAAVTNLATAVPGAAAGGAGIQGRALGAKANKSIHDNGATEALLQLLCYVSAHLPIDHMPAFIATAWEVLQSRTPAVAAVVRGATASPAATATAAAGLQRVVVAGFKARPGWMVEELSARVVRGVPEEVLRVLLMGDSSVSAAGAGGAHLVRLRGAIREKVGVEEQGGEEGEGVEGWEGEFVWQMGQNPGAGGSAAARAALRKQQGEGRSGFRAVEPVVAAAAGKDTAAATAAATAGTAAAGGGGGDGDRVLEVLRQAVAGIPAAAPAGGSMDAMQVRRGEGVLWFTRQDHRHPMDCRVGCL